MALGHASKSAIITAKAKGWDPNVIAGTGESIANFNRAPNPWESGDQSVGTLPAQGGINVEAESPLSERVSFRVPDPSREQSHHTYKGDGDKPGE